jgi:hypothetical protein
MKPSMPMSRRRALALGAGFLASGFASQLEAAAGRPAIIELFTSQGCSSCPPADALLAELKAIPHVVAMSFNVDYWDYLGWRDTLADAAYSQRQYSYAKTRGDMDVYTPQIIVDGTTHFVGSNKAVVRAAIDRSLVGNRSSWVPMTIEGAGREIAISVEAVPDRMQAQDATVWFMGIAPEIAVKIERGENSGREMVYHNVVRKLVPAGMWHGEALSLTLPKDDLIAECCKGCIALLQTRSVGPVIGCATWGTISA